MSEPKMEGVPMEFSAEELKNRVKAQKDDPDYNMARSEFQKEREAIGIAGEEGLRGVFEEFQLAQAFGAKEEAEAKLNQIRAQLQAGREKLEEGDHGMRLKKK